MVALKSSVRHEGKYDDYTDSSYEGGLHFSPGLAPTEEEYETGLRRETRLRGASPKRRSLGREILRIALFGFVIASISAAALASQYGAPETIQALKAIKKTVNHLSLELGMAPSVTTASRSASPRSQLPRQDPSESTLPTATAAHHVQGQLDTIASDVASVKGMLEQLANSQKQMAVQIAAVKATSDASSERTWWLTQSAAYNPPPSKSPHKVARTSTAPSPAADARP
jgi:hypothetical protein